MDLAVNETTVWSVTGLHQSCRTCEMEIQGRIREWRITHKTEFLFNYSGTSLLQTPLGQLKMS